MNIIYYNLGQCIGDRCCYFRSTDVEQKNYNRLLWSVPDDFLYNWSIGNTIIVKDETSNSKSSIGDIFIPILIEILNYYFYKKESQNKELNYHFYKMKKAIEKNKSLKQKFLFWKDRIDCIRLKADIKYVKKETNLIYKKYECKT